MTNGFGFSSCTEEYDGSSWSAGGSMINAKPRLAGAGTQNAAVGFGGMYPIVSCTEEYNGTSWSAGNALITGRAALGGAGTQDAGLAFGGKTPTLVTCTEEYNEGSPYFSKTFDYSSTTGKTMIIPPTSDPGVAGALWNNGGTLSISAG